jgi:hypothetical protein
LRPIAAAAALMGLSIWGALVVFAGDVTTDRTATATEAARDPMQEVTPERQAAAETFAGLHHPELAELLARLKTGRQKDYNNAVRELFRESERLAKLKGRDPERYALELEIWKVASRIQLTAARLAMDDSPELRAALLSLLESKLALRTQLLQSDRDRAAARLEKLDAELASLRADSTAAQQDLEKLLKSAQARANQAAKQNQNARFKPGNKSKTTEPAEAASKASTPASKN